VPQAASSSSSSSSSGSSSATTGATKVTLVKRLDGSVEEVPIGVPPSNPNFQPRMCHPGGKIVTSDKLEVLLRFYERKGKPLTPELEAKKAELDAAELEKQALWEKRGGGKQFDKKKKGKGKGKGKGGVVTLDGAEGGLKSKAARAADGAKAAEVAAPPKVAKEVSDWYKNRPKVRSCTRVSRPDAVSALSNLCSPNFKAPFLT
jgi:hypothetical protein